MKHPLALGLSLQAGAAWAASDKALAPMRPVVGYFLGYRFEWGPMIAGMLACVAVRFWVSQTEPEHRWTVDIPVSALALLLTAGVIMNRNPEPLMAIIYGTGIGALGAGIIKLALAFVQRNLGLLGEQGNPKT